MTYLKYDRAKPDAESSSRLTTVLRVFTNRKLSILWRLLITGVFIYILLNKIDVAKFLSSFKNIRLLLVFWAIGLIYCGNLILAYKWKIILRYFKINTAYLKLVKLYFIGHFFRNFLPGAFGSDLARGYGILKSEEKKTGAATSIIIERITSFSMGLFLAIVAWIILFLTHRSMVGGIELLVIGLAFLLFVLLFYVFRNFLIASLAKFLEKRGLNKPDQQVIEQIGCISRFPRTLVVILSLSLVYHLLTVIVCYSIALSLNIDVGLFYFFVFIPIITIVVMIPISLYGIGIREGAYVVFFGSAGLVAEKALSLSVLTFTIIVVSSLAGAFVYALQKSKI